MINLSVLTTDELAQVDKVLLATDVTLLMLLTNGAINEDEGVDLTELADAVAAEIERRTMEDAEHKVAEALARDEVKPVLRPDGQTGYQPSAL